MRLWAGQHARGHRGNAELHGAGAFPGEGARSRPQRDREPHAGTRALTLLRSTQAHGSAVDIFAFGVLLNEVFAREVPWDGYQPFDIKDRVVRSERPPMPNTMPRVCEGLVRKAWHQTACIRPRASQLVSALADVEDSLPVHTISARMLGDDALDQFASMRLSRTT